MTDMQYMDSERRKRNIRLALALGAFALFILFTSVPFWQGLITFSTSGGQ